MDASKIDSTRYEKDLKELEISIETSRLAMRDNFSQLLATDNFIEKYLPFRMQNMISESVMSFVTLTHNEKHHAKPEDPIISDFREKVMNKYKQFEYKTYKAMHRDVINDCGIPTLKKRAYQMPGYKKVLDDNERVAFDKALSK